MLTLKRMLRKLMMITVLIHQLLVDKTAKTKPSKYTKRFKAMFGEDAVAIAKTKIDKEKERNAIKHDKMMDRARLRKANNKNRETKGTTNAKI